MTTKTIQEIISWLSAHISTHADLGLDSRQIRPGDVFVACAGLHADGYDFIADAVARGAAAVLYDVRHQAPVVDVPTLAVAQLPALLGALAHEWYGRPSEQMTVIAVTGTNGKTSTSYWIAEALNNSGVPCASIGTLGVCMPDGSCTPLELTTPDVFTMHKSLARVQQAGANLVTLEASSIGLDQGRLDGVAIDIAAFTNLSHDHLDYHGDQAHYGRSKGLLFQRPGLRRVVVNLDDAYADEMVALTDAPVFTYSMTDAAADFYAQDIHPGSDGQVFQLVGAHGTAQFLTHQIGLHNISNYLLVAAVLNELGWPVSKIARIMATLSPVAGRLEIVRAIQAPGRATYPQPLVVVDYAHTPDALERALQSLRKVASVRGGRLHCVMGCGGNRDTAKRPEMGAIAQRLADQVVITNDNPRNESPADIAQAILSGARTVAAQEQTYQSEPVLELDRARAILNAIWQAHPDDIILIAGKGHENYQEIKGQRSYFSDVHWARLALTWLRHPQLSIDSRSIQQGELFWALVGERLDGHDYVAQAADKGALAAVVERPVAGLELPQIVVDDTVKALQKMATCWRQRFRLPVIAVTGSNGKTTTKEMIACILAEHFGADRYLATQGNFNNHIGVPLSVLRLRPEHQAAVFELGMNHPGEIAFLAAIAQPTVALVNNAQREHQEFMHSVEAVARENGSVLTALPADGVAVFPRDDEYAALWEELSAARKTIMFSRHQRAEVHAREVYPDAHWTRFTLVVDHAESDAAIAVPGVHNLHNALAASACATALNIPVATISAGLGAFRPVQGRMQPKNLADGFQLIDDSYNANPDSVRAAIEVLAQLEGKKILVLGDMAEVGIHHQAVHAEVGGYARERGVDLLCVIGQDAQFAAEAFGAQAHSFDDIESLQAFLLKQAPAHYLVKGSRSARMDRVVKHLEHALSEQGGAHAS